MKVQPQPLVLPMADTSYQQAPLGLLPMPGVAYHEAPSGIREEVPYQYDMQKKVHEAPGLVHIGELDGELGRRGE